MNTKLLTLVAILLSVMMLSCHDASEIKLTYRIELSEELEDVSDVKIVYTDFDGKEYRETMESGRWETSMTTPVPPVASMIRVEASRNANKAEDKEIVLEMDFSCVAERCIEGEIMESVAYTEFFNCRAKNSAEIVNALSEFDFERSYVIRSASDSSITMEQNIIDNQ